MNRQDSTGFKTKIVFYPSLSTLTSSSNAKWTGVESVRSLKNDGSETVKSTHLSKPIATTGNLNKNSII